MEEVDEVKAKALPANLVDLIPPVKDLTLEDLYRLRAASRVSSFEYKRTGRQDVPYYIYPKGKKSLPIAYVAGEELAKYFSKINEIVDIAIKNILENQKLQKEVARTKKNSNSIF